MLPLFRLLGAVWLGCGSVRAVLARYLFSHRLYTVSFITDYLSMLVRPRP